MHVSANSMANQVMYDTISSFDTVISDRVGYVVQMIPGFCILNAFEETFFRDFHQRKCFLRNLSHSMGSCCVGLVAVMDQTNIKTDNIPVLDDPVCFRDTVHYLIIDRYTHRCRVSFIAQERWDGTCLPDQFLSKPVNLQSGNSGCDLFS